MNKKYLKRVLSLICMIGACFGVVACSSTNTIDTSTVKNQSKQDTIDYYKANIKQWAVDFITYLDETDANQLVEDAENNVTLYEKTGIRYLINYYGFNDATVQVYNSWNSTRDELGSLIDIDEDSIDIEISEETGELCTISVTAAYENNDNVKFEFTIDDEYYVSGAAINPTYTVSQKMYKAAMNTVIGMGTVFVVLIFISFIISLFKYINRFQNKVSKKESQEDSRADVVKASDENLEDDYELVAVISAAIAAYEGETNSNGLIVRSIRRIR